MFSQGSLKISNKIFFLKWISMYDFHQITLKKFDQQKKSYIIASCKRDSHVDGN